MISSYKNLFVWQRGMQLCEAVYKVTASFPKSEIYGITSQIRRCCVSIPSNIAEGNARGHKAEYKQFLRIAFGSGAELETQLLLAQRIGYLNAREFKEINDLLTEVMRMLNKLISNLKS